MAIADKIKDSMDRSSWIRKMFEEGAGLKSRLGAENIYDFTLGNPDVYPPEVVETELVKIIHERIPMKYGYMPNSGYPETRQAVAGTLSQEQQTSVPADSVVMTCGAGGALNVIFKTILNPGDEVISPRPFFVEYNFYVDNHGGVLKTVDTLNDFTLDTESIATAITKKTKAVIINSPNNPSGVIFPESQIRALGKLLEQKSAEIGHPIYLISDEPYRKIIYDNAVVPPVFPFYKNSIIANSYSKALSLAGERIGFLALNPDADDFSSLTAGFIFSNRILGFVNAPGIMQRLVAKIQGATIDISRYKRKRDLIYAGIINAGFTVTKPQGAFYLFPKSPINDDVHFVRILQDHKILAVPGSGFGCPGYFRLAYCIDNESIERSLPVFKKVGEQFFG